LKRIFKFIDMEDFLNFIINLAKMVAAVCAMGLVVGFICWIVYGGDSSEDSSNSYYEENTYGSNVNFKGSYNDNYRGRPCKHRDLGDTETCGEKGDCYGGFNSQNWDASKCNNCGHSYRDHR